MAKKSNNAITAKINGKVIEGVIGFKDMNSNDELISSGAIRKPRFRLYFHKGIKKDYPEGAVEVAVNL